MGFLDRLLGRETSVPQDRVASRPARPDSDEAAVERYRYLLRTAPPDAIEQAHREAFATLTPQQRQQVLRDLGSQVPASERAASDQPADLARMATRAEMRRPGTLESSFGGGSYRGGGLGLGGVIGGSLLASVAGAFVGTAIADAMFQDATDQASGSGDDSGDSGDGSGDGESGDGGSGDGGSGDGGSGDGGSGDGGSGDGGQTDSGDAGGFGDFGGGDFGGDFGGGGDF